jgi:hypothetical protein
MKDSPETLVELSCIKKRAELSFAKISPVFDWDAIV